MNWYCLPYFVNAKPNSMMGTVRLRDNDTVLINDLGSLLTKKILFFYLCLDSKTSVSSLFFSTRSVRR